jgi:hypothetical protein
VPNFLTTTGLQTGRSLISIAGTHGTGTRAIEVLLRDKQSLKQISEAIPQRTQAFQILIEVSKVTHSEVAGSVAHRVHILDMQCFDRPERSWDSARKAFTRSVVTAIDTTDR